jgi:hypothetical protein
MVKTAKTKSKDSLAKLRKKPGRPTGPKEDLRSHRIAFRIHPDLTAEMNRIARINGEVRTAWIERMMISVINNSYGYNKLDAIGRYVDYGDEPPPFGQPKQTSGGAGRPFDPGRFGAKPSTLLSLDDLSKLPDPPKRR